VESSMKSMTQNVLPVRTEQASEKPKVTAANFSNPTLNRSQQQRNIIDTKLREM